MFTLTFKILELPLEFEFKISRNSKTLARTVLVELFYKAPGSQQDILGYGEAVPSKFYGEDADTVIAFYQQLLQDNFFEGMVSPHNMQAFETKLSAYPKNMAAKAGLDIAMQDIRAKLLNLPLYALWGLDPSRAPKTSYTIGIADLKTIERKTSVALSRGYDVLKIKLGSSQESLDQDLRTLEKIRQLAPHASIRVDANAGWTLQQALQILPALRESGVEFVEEPLMLTSSREEYETLKKNSPIPLMADESCHILRDIPRCAQYFHAINLKHSKTGGLSEAHRMIHAARAHGLKIMLGCFAESSVSISAFSHLSPLVDYADLDGGLLLADDPFEGVRFSGSQLILPKAPGLGVQKKTGVSH